MKRLQAPLILRPLDIYHVLIGKEERDEESRAYLDKITSWFVQRYGDEAVWDGVLSRDPDLLPRTGTSSLTGFPSVSSQPRK
jgi:hypothetical protein